MITHSDLFPIGYVAKTHGIKGELNIALDTKFNPEDFRFLIFEMDSIFVPFEIENSRGASETSRLVTLKGISGVDDAREFVGKTAYVTQDELRDLPGYDEAMADEGLYLSDLVGYKIVNPEGFPLGEIVGFNDETQNYLLEIESPDGNRRFFIPYVEEWITLFDPDNKTIGVSLPHGLTDI